MFYKLIKYMTGTFFTLIIGLITTPILTRIIQAEELGKYSMFVTLGGFVSSLLYLGLDQAYVRFFNDEKEENRELLLKKCLSLPLLISVFFSLFMLIFYKDISDIIVGESNIIVVVLESLYIIFSIINRFWNTKFRMMQNAGFFSVLSVMRKLVYLILALCFICFFRKNYISLILAVTFAEMTLIIIQLFYDKDRFYLADGKLDTDYRTIIRYAIPFIFSIAVGYALNSTDKIMLRILSDYHEIGIYSGAQSIVNLLVQVQLVFSTLWVPVSFEHYSKNPQDKTFYQRINLLISFIMLSVSVLLLCLKDVIIYFLGSGYHDAVYVFPFLMFMPIMYTVSETTVVGINFIKKSFYHLVVSLICCVVNIIGNFMLIGSWGAKGAAIATGLSYVVFWAFRTYFSNKVYPVNYSNGKFIVSCVMIYGLAIWASFSKVTFTFILVSLCIVSIIIVLYWDIVRLYSGMVLKHIIRY